MLYDPDPDPEPDPDATSGHDPEPEPEPDPEPEPALRTSMTMSLIVCGSIGPWKRFPSVSLGASTHENFTVSTLSSVLARWTVILSANTGEDAKTTAPNTVAVSRETILAPANVLLASMPLPKCEWQGRQASRYLSNTKVRSAAPAACYSPRQTLVGVTTAALTRLSAGRLLRGRHGSQRLCREATYVSR
jgi:hypothetical protein